jgi:hypothetical protein
MKFFLDLQVFSCYILLGFLYSSCRACLVTILKDFSWPYCVRWCTTLNAFSCVFINGILVFIKRALLLILRTFCTFVRFCTCMGIICTCTGRPRTLRLYSFQAFFLFITRLSFYVIQWFLFTHYWVFFLRLTRLSFCTLQVIFPCLTRLPLKSYLFYLF